MDWYADDYYETCFPYVKNPHGPTGDTLRVMRGGSWVDFGFMRCARRAGIDPSLTSIHYGVRLVAGT